MDESRQCTATARSGNRCKRAAIKGGRVCNLHGGKAPQVVKAAQIRIVKGTAISEAERMVARAGVDADPIEHLLESLHRAAALVEVWGTMVAQLDDYAADKIGKGMRGGVEYHEVEHDNGVETVVRPDDYLMVVNAKGEAKTHPFVLEYNNALERRARFAKLCIDAGVAERQVRLLEEQGQMIAKFATDLIADLKIKRTAKVNAVIGKRLRQLEPNFG